MEKVKARDTQFELVGFFQQALDKAITTRLSFAQRESNNDDQQVEAASFIISKLLFLDLFNHRGNR